MFNSIETPSSVRMKRGYLLVTFIIEFPVERGARTVNPVPPDASITFDLHNRVGYFSVCQRHKYPLIGEGWRARNCTRTIARAISKNTGRVTEIKTFLRVL